MLEMAAVRVFDGSKNEVENQDRENQDGQRGPIIRASNLPSCAKSPECPVQRMKAYKKKDEKNCRREEEAVANMMKHVMPHLMSKYKENFGRGHLRDGRIPHDHALGRADSCDIRVQCVQLGTGVHQIHACCRNLLSAMLDHSFKSGSQLRIGSGKRGEPKEERL